MPSGIFSEMKDKERDDRALILTDAVHGGGANVQLTPTQHIVKVFTGATGVINVDLPDVSQVPIGTQVCVYLELFNANNCVVGYVGPELVAWADLTMIATADYVIAERTYLGWTRIQSCLNSVVAPA